MNKSNLFTNTNSWNKLKKEINRINQKDFHLKQLINKENRRKNFSRLKCNLYMWYVSSIIHFLHITIDLDHITVFKNLQ